MDGSGYAILALLVAWGVTALIMGLVLRSRGAALGVATKELCEKDQDMAKLLRRIEHLAAKTRVEGMTDEEALRDFNSHDVLAGGDPSEGSGPSTASGG